MMNCIAGFATFAISQFGFWYRAITVSLITDRSLISEGCTRMSNDSSQTGDLPVVAVVGAGFLGKQIAALCAASGRQVRLTDAVPAAAEDAREWLRDFLAEPVAD